MILQEKGTGKRCEFKMTDNLTGTDFTEEWLDAGSLDRADNGDYLVNDIEYIIDYADTYAEGTNPDFEGSGNCVVFWWYM